MTVTIQTTVDPFEERDDDGFLFEGNRVVAEIRRGEEVLWTSSVVTDDTIESVCTVRETQYLKAAQHAAAHYGYKLGVDDYEAAGLIVTPV